jgi:hypothetical protein
MKISLPLLVFFALAFTLAGFGQSVVITGKKVVYKRAKPMADHKKSFTINYPKVKAATPALSKKIESAMSYASVLGINVKEEQNDIQWLELADYEVAYNKNGILSIKLFMEGTGAYPSGSTKNVVVDLKTGTRVKPPAAFTNLPRLLSLVRKAKEKEVADSIVEIKKDPENKDADPESLFKDSDQYHKVSLNEFSVDDKGVTFYHDYAFPHVIQALQPVGTFTFNWQQLKPYIKPGGLLTRVAR